MGTNGIRRINTYEKLIDKHKGQVAFVCGAGPSLYDAICTYAFRDIFKYVVISVNSSIMAMPWHTQEEMDRNGVDPDRCYWISNDALCRRWSWWQMVKDANCTKIVRNSWLKYKAELDGFLYFSPRPTPEDIIKDYDKGLAYCSSGCSAIDLAIQMGCDFICLLGIDNGFDHGYTHFWQLWDKDRHPIQYKPAHGPREQQEQVFELNKQAYAALHDFARKKHAGIINCSPLSQLNQYLKITLYAMVDVLKDRDKDE